jgi:HSP20 family protein
MQMTMLVRRTAPFGDILSLRDAMDRLMEDAFVRPPGSGNGYGTGSFPIDVRSDTEALTIEAALPGFSPEEVEITVEGGTLTINAERNSEVETTEGEYLVREMRRGRVSRVISLPSGLEADKSTASFEHGVLNLRIPRAEETKPRQIRISPTVESTAR